MPVVHESIAKVGGVIAPTGALLRAVILAFPFLGKKAAH